MGSPSVPTIVEQAEQKANQDATSALSVLEEDAISFIKQVADHANTLIPQVTSEVGHGLNALITKAQDLAAKHGFTL